MIDLMTPGTFVRNKVNPDWGIGQVQSNVNGKVTVNFENCGKIVFDSRFADLELEFDFEQ